MLQKIEILTERFLLRELTLEVVTKRYLGWFSDRDTKKFIVSAETTQNLSDFKQYVFDRIFREDILFLVSF